MNHRHVHLLPGLYLCAVPIGNARDITLRALDILASADLIASEDTRSTRKLMDIHGVPIEGRKFIAYHDHSSPQARNIISKAIQDGQSVAYVSEAGTPLVADPGYKLAGHIRSEGHLVTTAPGATAAIAALAISGLPSDRFHFAGFLPSASAGRKRALESLKPLDATIILYESPNRLQALLNDICDTLGQNRRIAVCREITKKFEEVLAGTSSEIRAEVEGRNIKGEIVVLIDRGSSEPEETIDVESSLKEALETMRVKDAAEAVAGATGLPRREVYQMALKMKGT